MTEAMPFLRKLILLSYAPRPWAGRFFFCKGGLGNLVGLEAGCCPVCESWRRSPHPASPFWAR